MAHLLSDPNAFHFYCHEKHTPSTVYNRYGKITVQLHTQYRDAGMWYLVETGFNIDLSTLIERVPCEARRLFETQAHTEETYGIVKLQILTLIEYNKWQHQNVSQGLAKNAPSLVNKYCCNTNAIFSAEKEPKVNSDSTEIKKWQGLLSFNLVFSYNAK